ncbi:histidine phosphatase superfamily [Blastocladiella britannica]|nr:histidine phosphatase superfamily [Blastocladiella britannica]
MLNEDQSLLENHSGGEDPQKPKHASAGRGRRRFAVALFGTFALFIVALPIALRHKITFSLTFANKHEEADFHRILGRMRNATSRYGYCAAATPRRTTYPALSPSLAGARLVQVQVLARHGDRAPQNVMRDDVDSGVDWQCKSSQYAFLGPTNDDGHDDNGGDPTSPDRLVAKRVSHIRTSGRDRPRMWGGSCVPSELTEHGRAQLTELGADLRDVYVEMLGLLPKNFTSSDIRVRATDVSRTLASAHALADGFLTSPTHRQATNNNNNNEAAYRQVNVYTMPEAIDPLHSNKLDLTCPRLKQLQSQLPASPMWPVFLAHSAPTSGLVQALAPLKFEKPPAAGKKGVPSVTENLMCRRCWSKPLPCIDTADHLAIAATGSPAMCLSETTLDAAYLYKSFDFYYRNNYWANRMGRETIRLEMGPLLREMLATLPRSDRDLKHVPQFIAYLTHDGTFSGLLGALRAAPEHHIWPSYRANIAVEVWELPPEAGSRYRVRVLLDGQPLKLDRELIGDFACASLGDGSCDLHDLRAFFEANSAPDWEMACAEE